jgi:hypothetical protein
MFTGLMLAIICLNLFQVSSIVRLNDDLSVLLFKFCCLLTIMSTLFSYLFIKINSENIFKLYYNMKKYDNNSFSDCKIGQNISHLIAIVLMILIIALSLMSRYKNSFVNEIFKDVYEYEENLSTPSIISLIIFYIYIYGWKLFIQFIYFDINSQYVSILKAFNCELKRKIGFPNINVIKMTQRTVIQLMFFQTDIRKNVDSIKNFKLLDAISFSACQLIVLMKCSLLLNLNNFHIHFGYLTVLYIYFLWTQFINLKIKRNESNLKTLLNRWQKFKSSDQCFIELEILDRTVQQFLEFDIYSVASNTV